MRKLFILFTFLSVSLMGFAVTYCDFATGHENNANFGDANGRILLTLVPTANANEYTLTVKPNYANGATKQLDYLYVIAGGNSPYPAEAGADEGGTGYDELSVTFTNSSATASFTIQWSNPDWGGRWQCTLTDVALSELTACSGGGSPTPDPDPDPTPDPEPVSYCDFPTGHEGNPNFGDANGRILLSLEPTGNANEYKMTIKPNYDNGATKKLDYLYVIAAGNSPYPAEAGIDESGIGYDELSVTFTNSNATVSFTIQWSNPDWGGRWQCTLADVELASLTPCSAPTIASEYCGEEMSSGNTLAKFTWETTAEGNVNITISEALGGASNASYFRGNGITDTKIKIGEGRDPITTYFTHPGSIQGQQTLTLTLTDPANAPDPGTKIYVESQIIEYATSKDGNAWPTLSFEYTYGGVCAEEKVLTDISLTASSTFALVGDGVTLTAQGLDQMGMPIEAEISFEVSPANAGNFAGNVFTFAKTGAATITARSGAVEKSITLYGVPSANLALDKPATGGYYDNNPAEGFDKANDGNTNTAWVTYADRPASEEWWYVDLEDTYSLTAVDVVWGDPSSTSYKIFARMDAPTAEQEADDSEWEEIASVSGIGINSEQFNEVNVNARYIRIHSLTKSANFLRLKEVRVFGTAYVPVVDTQKPVMTSASLASSTYTEAVINVAATDDVGIYRYHVVDASNGIDANFAESAGQITVNNLTHGTAYNFTITAKDAAGNESDNSCAVAVTTPFDASTNLALNQPCEGGYYDNNPVESADKANDGADNTSWVTYGAHAATLDWWVVDLGNVYNLTNITALWANDAYATAYMLQARVEAPTAADKADDAAWVTLANVSGVTAGEERSTNVSGVGRYVRFRATAFAGGFFRLREFRVYGSGVAETDAEAPVMTSASLVSSADTYAVIAVAATDNQGIACFHVEDEGNSFVGNFVAEAGNITVTDLAGGTAYNLVITAIDFFGNESENSKSVAVNTTAHYTEPQAACTAPEWDAALVKAIYSPTYSADCNFANWAGCTAYTADTYGKKFEVGAECWGFGLDGFTLNCVTMQKLHADIWVADDASLRLVPIYGGTGLTTDDSHGKMVNLEGQTWNSIDLTLASDFAGLNLSSIFQFKIDNANGLTFWIGNLYFYRESAIVDNEDPVIVSASVTEESFTSVKITVQATDDSGAVNFSVKNGDTEVATAAAASGEEKVIIVNGLASGTHFNLTVIASDEAGNETSSSPLSATTKLLPPPAPVPTEQSADVKSLFSDVYSPIVAVENYCEWWWESPTVHTDLSVGAGDKVLYYDNNHQAGASFGWAWNAANKVDFGGFQMLHISIYPTQAGTIEIYPVVAGVTTNKISQALVANKWNEVVLNYTDKEFAPMNQIGFINFYDLGSFFIDNVYFAKSPDLSRDASTGDDWMAPGELGTICIPNGAIAKGGDIYELVGKNSEGKIVFATVPNNQMTPGKPYLFEATSNAMKFYYTAEDAVGNPVNTGAMKGTFADITLPDTDLGINDLSDIYYFADHALWSCADISTLSVPANRAYVKLSEVDNIGSSSPAPGRRYITMGVNGKDAATGFDQLNASEAPMKMIIDGQLFILRGEKLYDATGRLVK
ncbi:MAG: discoidin domain-containing protein [Paludibacteraceae bacterium]|nr:discoidin domain-containing protein [Paludibacteraceae bacterium]